MISTLGLVLLVLGQIHHGHAWDNSYLNAKAMTKKYANTVGDVYFRLFSTKFPGSKSLLEWEDATDSEERILFDEDTQTASLVEDTMFDPTLKTIVVAHGNTGKLQVDRLLWKSYSEAANNDRGGLGPIGEHYNIIGIRWGQGPSGRHLFSGIKAARVIQSLSESYGLEVSTIHGLGFSYGGHVISAMATEIFFSNLGKIHRLSLLDPGTEVSVFKVKGEYAPVEGQQIGFVNKNFAEFMDVYHSSKMGIHKEKNGASPFVGHLDVWLNGGLGGVPDLIANPHPSAVYFFASTILGQCLPSGYKCEDKNWAPWALDEVDGAKRKDCSYGKGSVAAVGEYLDTANPPSGSYMVFFDSKFQYCHDMECLNTVSCGFEDMPSCECNLIPLSSEQ